MLTDAHCHPFDLPAFLPEFENERRQLGVITAASAHERREFAHNEVLSRNAALDNAPPLFACFGIHPQIFKIKKDQFAISHEHRTINIEQLTNNSEYFNFKNLLETLEMLASGNRIAALGECGFDLYNAAFRETETLQDRFFTAQLETALRYELPVVLHIRRAMHKVFAVSDVLSKCKAVIFHSWPGAFEEAEALLRRGVNAYFSFGNTITLNHKHAMRSCALLPAERLLTETDAPYQPRRGQTFSQWTDLPLILEAASSLRNEAGNKTNVYELENQIEKTFRNIFI